MYEASHTCTTAVARRSEKKEQRRDPPRVALMFNGFGTRVGSGGNGLAIRRRETVWNMMWIRLQSKSEEYDHVRQTVYSYYFLASSF